MIGRLQGRVIEAEPGQVLLDVGGVGYEVDIPVSTFERIAGASEPVTLYTHFAVREDAQQLFGFADRADRDLFREVIKVKGVGPRLALTIMSGMPGSELVQCVHHKDVKALTAIRGLGKKTAEQLILDLSGKLPEIALAEIDMATTRAASSTDNMADAEAALIGLGFKPQEAARALARVEDAAADVETLIKQALKALA